MHSIQGEGFHGGRSAFFVRLADGDGGWGGDGNGRERGNTPACAPRPLEMLASQARQACEAGAAFAVIVAEDPLRYELGPLCEELAASGLPLHLEANGGQRLSGRFDWITLIPNRQAPPSQELLASCHELKVVVVEEADLRFAEEMAQAANDRYGNPPPQLLLQPSWGCLEGQRLAVNYVLHHPDWRLSLRSNRWLGMG